MIYFANPVGGGEAVNHMIAGRIGYIDTPLQGNARPENVAIWCADNGCFGKGFDPDVWFAWLESHVPFAGSCRFATAPDVVGDAVATLERAQPWLPRIRALGYPAAFVAQDGIETIAVPWDEFDALFIGGSTEFKLGAIMRSYAHEAKDREKWLHMGRVNSLRRLRYAEAIGCDSVDGTHLIFKPSVRLPELLGWIRDVQERPALFGREMIP